MRGAPDRFGSIPVAGALLGAVLSGGCSPPEPPAPASLRLEQVRPGPDRREGVFLNEAIVLHFSEEVDTNSITAGSFEVRAMDGREPRGLARGRYEVAGRRVRFLPDLGRARDLGDGGLRPGTRYEVCIQGFPALDAVRSIDGKPLGKSQRIEFVTAAMTEPRGQMFDDRTPAVGALLRLSAEHFGTAGTTDPTLGERGSLFLNCAEPLDPSTLVDGAFVLLSQTRAGISVPCDPYLLENDAESGARLELRPRRVLAPGVYRLRAPGGLSLRDFGGNPVVPANFQQQVLVQSGDEYRPEFSASFRDTRLRSNLLVPEVDGAAYWGEGRVTVRWPRVAGDGGDGPLRLAEAEGRRDVHATQIEVDEAARVELLSVPGLVVLRAQGKLTVTGELVRRSGMAQRLPFRGAFRRGEAASEWLERARTDDRNWTVLIAGGDLVIEGTIDVEGPLILIAGGRLRITGEVSAQQNQLWRAGEGGGGQGLIVHRAELTLDEPLRNPLVEPLTFGLLTGPMPPEGGVRRWRSPVVGGEHRGGEFTVSYLPMDLPLGEPFDDWGAVAHPSDLESGTALRLLIVLRVDPPDPQDSVRKWEPPFVDEVRLYWEGE